MIISAALTAIPLASLVGIPALVAIITRRVVPTNMVHIVQSSKKSVPYGPKQSAGNTYYEFPSWVPFVGVLVSKFPESVFSISLKDYEAYDKGRLPFIVDVKAFFRISDSTTAAQRVSSFSELEGQLTAVLQGAVRRILATSTLENIMEDRSTLGEAFTKEVDSQLREWGVSTVKMIEFLDIRDSGSSEVIKNMMAKEKSRIEKESRIAVALNMQEAQTKEIEAKRVVDNSKTDAEQQVQLRVAEKDKIVGQAKEKSTQDVLAEQRSTKEREMDIIKVQEIRNAEIVQAVKVVEEQTKQKQAEITKNIVVINATAEKDVKLVEAEGVAKSQVTIADGNLQATIKTAEGIKETGKAEAEAETAKLLAPVTAQTTLAEKIAELPTYQSYLVEIRKVEAQEAVGKAQAGALEKAEVKIIANGGDIQSGVGSISSLFSPAGGTALGGALTALANTEEGKALVDKLTGKK